MPWAAAGAIGGALISDMSASDAADKQAQAAKDAAAATKFTPYNIHNGFGSVTWGHDPATGAGQPNVHPTSIFGDHNSMINGMDQNQGQPSMTTSLSAPYQQLRDNYMTDANNYQSQMGQYGNDFVNGTYKNMLAMNQPYEQQQQSSLENRLAAQGMLGSTGGGWQQQALQNSFNTNHLGMQTQAIGLGDQLQNSLLSRYNTATQGAAAVDNLPMESAKLGASVGQMQSYGNQFGAGLTNNSAAWGAANNAQFWNGIGQSLQPGGSLSNALGQAGNKMFGSNTATPSYDWSTPSYDGNMAGGGAGSFAPMNSASGYNSFFNPGSQAGN